MSPLLCALLAVAVPEPLTFLSEARVEGEIVRLADVADLSVLPVTLRDRAALVPVARLSAADQTVSSRDVAARARGAVPALSAWLPPAPDRPIHVRSLPPHPGDPDIEPPAAAPREPAVRAGDFVTISIRVGPVVVERDVQALQDGRVGHPVFVRTPEGAVLTGRIGTAP